jgi:hypothetical protein
MLQILPHSRRQIASSLHRSLDAQDRRLRTLRDYHFDHVQEEDVMQVGRIVTHRWFSPSVTAANKKNPEEAPTKRTKVNEICRTIRDSKYDPYELKYGISHRNRISKFMDDDDS